LASLRSGSPGVFARQVDDDGKQAASINGLQLEGPLPGVTINTSATDFAPIKQMQLKKFRGERWEMFGDVISSEVGE
jgi:branched-chain amino acid transport system substrate-binding protein